MPHGAKLGSLFFGAHVVEGENRLLRVVPTITCRPHTWIHTQQMNVEAYTYKQISKWKCTAWKMIFFNNSIKTWLEGLGRLMSRWRTFWASTRKDLHLISSIHTGEAELGVSLGARLACWRKDSETHLWPPHLYVPRWIHTYIPKTRLDK